MIPRVLCVAVLATITIAAPKPRIRLSESETVERGLVTVRLDPKIGAKADECVDLSAADLTVTVGRRAAKVTSVERVPRPLRHWLLVDISESAAGRREEAKRSAAQYVREVMTPGVDSAAVLSVDEDLLLVAGPSTNPDKLARDVEGMPPGGWSALMDGLDFVLRQIQGDRHEHLVLFWTDGSDTQSLITAGELLSGLARAPNATVFPIALLPKGSTVPTPPLTGVTFTEVARRSGGEVFISSDPRWLDRVRGWIERRFTVGFVPPETTGERSSRGGLAITVPSKRCQVTVLDDPFGRPDPVAGAAPPPPAAWVGLHKISRPLIDVPCAGTPQDTPWEWPLRAEGHELSGCVLDFTQSPGPIVGEGSRGKRYGHQPPHVVQRGVRVLAPDVSQLPTDPAEMIDTTTPDNLRDPTPHLMEGSALLAQRTRIATSLFAERRDYHEFALDRLRRFAEDDLRAIERDLSHAFPGKPADEIAAAARASRAGRRALEAARTPTDADVARALAAWIRDVPAAEVLESVEKRLIDARLQKREIAPLVSHWMALASRFGTPFGVRVVAPLVLLRDPGQDVIGFARVVLPRPERFLRERPGRQSDEPIDARLPARPFALFAVDALLERPGSGETLAQRGYRATSITYEPLEPLDRQDPMRPYASAHVTLALEQDESKVTLTADAAAFEDGYVGIFGLEVSADASVPAPGEPESPGAHRLTTPQCH